MNERRSVSAHYECFPDAGSGSVFHIMCICTFAAGGPKVDRGWERDEKLLYCTCTHGGLRLADSVCSVVSKNYIQVIVFYLLAQTKVIYLHIYKPINKVS